MRVLTEANCLEITGGLNLVCQDRSNEDGGSNGYGMPGVLFAEKVQKFSGQPQILQQLLRQG